MKRLVAGLVLASLGGAALALPAYEEVKAGYTSSDTLVLDRNGEVLQRVRTDATIRRGQWVALADISPALRRAMLASEDRNFYEHSGVDWSAVSSAAWGNLWHQRTRGASTITMQLAGLLDDDLKAGAAGRNPAQKLGQAVAARVLDRRWRKDQILEAYLNLVSFRGEVAGIDAMSRTLFGKAPHGLDAREGAIAAALVRAPNAKPQAVGQRACGVLRAMDPANAKLDCEPIVAMTMAAVQRRATDADEGIAPHVARRALAQRGDAKAPAATGSIRTTLRADVQRFAVQSLQRHLRELHGRNVEDGAVIVLDNATGDVLAWVGSSGELSDAAQVDGVLARRQAGSTLKPFLYAQALAERRLTAASLLEDSPAHLATASGLYVPQNYDRQFKGWVSMRTALAASLNVPAVRTVVQVSPEPFARTLRAAGVSLKEDGGYYGYSIALGSPEVTLLDMANAYRTLANGGAYSSVSPIRAAPNKLSRTRAIDERAAFIIGDILSDPNARARTFGTDSLLATRFWTAVKTGTSKDMRDNWALGWSQRYTVGVWVGNASGAAMHDVSGTTGAAPVWAAVMGYLHTRENSRAPKPPAGVVRAHVRFGDRLEAERDEWFLPGTEQAVFALAPANAPGAAPRITAPADGAIIALDPDIPPLRQRLQFTATGERLRWLIDGKEAARGASLQWLPWPGRHHVQLANEQGAVLDDIRIEVRGAGVLNKIPAAGKKLQSRERRAS
ncbi:penicillin-binding protein 1C [Caenimonas koreensis DSM 17982]|uniref:peptidoglycan glycosyltransferase n=1 Tax=Caenimonas koreensis DSM 17982 TaxID=1121255 RepID=A0A844AZ27_9BURK|nr:penicillin-binding protein 1C [Caenimonas koreensis]MRD47668.1 penicillin-binding protein 1C [Caenimonas koreensis DSM 17982]